jgi:Fe2+ or Zn2+ uptake regulation protein
MEEHADTITEIQESVLGYLAEHPGAADSVDGIRNWWLFQRMARASTERVQRALDDLEVAGCIERATLQDGSVLYRRTNTNKAIS